jgi:enoyl-CoA hydratase/carnithine racemase
MASVLLAGHAGPFARGVVDAGHAGAFRGYDRPAPGKRPDMPHSHASTPLLRIDGPVATIVLNRPAQRNALHDADLHALLDAFARLDADPAIRVVVLDANVAGQRRPVFSAGYNLAGLDDADHGGPGLFERVPDALEALRPITICALRGSVYGGATDLVLACDLRVGLAGTEFRMPAAAIGLHYYPSGLRRYVSRLGPATAKRAFLTAKALPIERLDALGLFDTLADDDPAFDAALDELVRTVAALAPIAAQGTKRSLDEIAAGAWTMDTLREREDRARRSEDFAEGRAAVAQKRPPRFTGR